MIRRERDARRLRRVVGFGSSAMLLAIPCHDFGHTPGRPGFLEFSPHKKHRLLSLQAVFFVNLAALFASLPCFSIHKMKVCMFQKPCYLFLLYTDFRQITISLEPVFRRFPALCCKRVFFHTPSLLVIWFMMNNAKPSVNLFQQNDPHQLMRECHRRKT